MIEIYNKKGISFYKKNQYRTALKWYEKCLPDCDNRIYYNIGLCYHSLGEYDKAMEFYKKYEKLSGIENIYEKCLVYLLKGDYKKGLEIYQTRNGNFPNLPLKWIEKIDDLKDTNLLVLNEQGFGDEFLFSKSFSDLSKLCKSCKVQVYPETIDLFKELYPNIDFFTDRSFSIKFVSQFDSYTSTGDLFSLYNRDSIKKYKYRETDMDSGRVGIFYAANPKSKNSKKRSINPNLFKPLLKNYKLVNLQKGHHLKFCENPILNNFLDTKKVIENLDFVVTIDSSVANLCGILGKECYLVKKDYLDWRYVNNFYKSIEVININDIKDL